MTKGTGEPSGDECQNLVAQPFSPHGHYRYEASEHAATLQDRENRQGGHTHLVAQAFRKSKRAQSATDDETWVDDGLENTLNGFDTGDARTTHAISFHPTQDPISDSERTHALGCGSKQGCATVAVAFSCKDHGADASAVAPTLRAMPHSGSHANGGGQVAVAHAFYSKLGTHGSGATPELSQPLKTGSPLAVAVATSMVVRRLTPVECERLQGFPDGWTDVGTPEKPTADSHRYKQLGNAVTVNVAEWLARRIATVLKSQQ